MKPIDRDVEILAALDRAIHCARYGLTRMAIASVRVARYHALKELYPLRGELWLPSTHRSRTHHTC
jgi:hypothetical protein